MNLLLATVLVASVTTGDLLLEAEDAEPFGVVVDTVRAGFSGTGYVTGFDEPGDSLRFRFEVPAGVYEIRLGYAQTSRIQSYELRVDGGVVSGTTFGTGNTFREQRLTDHRFAEGAHTIVLGGGFDVDYLRLVPMQFDPPAPPSPVLTDAGATPSTQALFRFLVDQYGTKILSGQQELREVDYVVSVTGLEPAVAGGDLIEYSPSRWERGARPNKQRGYASVEDLIAWAREDGIVALMWHWNAPTDLVGEWWRGFYTDATTFDVATALADTTSERYRLLLRDIDAIAAQLQKFEDADVPLLWRPLHEAAGGWFWWGARGAGPFRELWRLLYDRLVHHHGLHHLIWVYTHEPGAEAWYPGDAYVDVVSRDVYASDSAATMRGEWGELQELFGGRKLVALSESGTLPDPAVYTDYGVWWSWFSLWSDWPDDGRLEYTRALEPAYLTQVFASEHVLTRDELPDWRQQYATHAEPPAPGLASGLTLHPNPTAGPVVLHATLPAPADIRVEVFDMLGRRVHAVDAGSVPAGEHTWTIDLGGAPAGVYVARVAGGEYIAHRTFVVAR